MKSARERAQEVAAMFDVPEVDSWLDALEHVFKEYADDQRLICAACVHALGGRVTGIAMQKDAYAAVMDAPAPGE